MIQPWLSATQLAIRAIARNKLRATLTTVGILIGVAAVVFVSSLGSGARANINDKVQSLGANVIVIFSQPNQASGARNAQGSGSTLTETDVKALLRESISVAAAAPVLSGLGQLVYESRNASLQLSGTTLDYFRVRSWDVQKGELWRDNTVMDKVVVLGASTATNLFGTLDPLGQSIRIGKHPFRVIGVLEAKGQSPFGGQDQDDIALIPIGVFRSHIAARAPGAVDVIMLSATSANTVANAAKQTESILRQLHRIADSQDPDFGIRTQAELQKSQDAIYGTLSTLLLIVGLISLGVGGIGIMNIMLVSVAERTREIGVRMAIGANEDDIMIQFLVEAVVLALLGGIGGTIAGVLVIILFRAWLEWPMHVQALPLFASLATSMIIGIVFGFFPARRAAKMDPIQALGRD